jgi:hypothetical protein
MVSMLWYTFLKHHNYVVFYNNYFGIIYLDSIINGLFGLWYWYVYIVIVNKSPANDSPMQASRDTDFYISLALTWFW